MLDPPLVLWEMRSVSTWTLPIYEFYVSENENSHRILGCITPLERTEQQTAMLTEGNGFKTIADRTCRDKWQILPAKDRDGIWNLLESRVDGKEDGETPFASNGGYDLSIQNVKQETREMPALRIRRRTLLFYYQRYKR